MAAAPTQAGPSQGQGWECCEALFSPQQWHQLRNEALWQGKQREKPEGCCWD